MSSCQPGRLVLLRAHCLLLSALRQGQAVQQCARTARRCDGCGLDYGSSIPATARPCSPSSFLASCASEARSIVEFKFGVPGWVHVLLWGILTPLVALVLLRFLKAVLIALQYRHKAEEGRLAQGVTMFARWRAARSHRTRPSDARPAADPHRARQLADGSARPGRKTDRQDRDAANGRARVAIRPRCSEYVKTGDVEYLHVRVTGRSTHDHERHLYAPTPQSRAGTSTRC